MKVLIVQQKMIGDVLLSSMLCELIKKNNPNTIVHYLINSNTEAVVTNNPYIDRIIFFTDEYRNSKWSFYGFLKEVTRENYDVVIDAYCKLESMLVSLFSKASVKISMDKWYSRPIYTKTFKYKTTGYSNLGLAVDNRLTLLKPFLGDLEKVSSQPRIYLTDVEILDARLFLEKNGIDFFKPIIMINILGSSEHKTYPLSYMAKVIDHVASEGDFTILFNYMPSQLKVAKKVYSLCAPASKAKIKFDVYTPLLRSFLGVLYHCNALIGNEGGAINMAKALKVPTFSIFSPWVEKVTWETFKHTKRDIAVHLNDYEPLLIKGRSIKELRKEAQNLYYNFKPLLFQEMISHFLNTKIFIQEQDLLRNRIYNKVV